MGCPSLEEYNSDYWPVPLQRRTTGRSGRTVRSNLRCCPYSSHHPQCGGPRYSARFLGRNTSFHHRRTLRHCVGDRLIVSGSLEIIRRVCMVHLQAYQCRYEAQKDVLVVSGESLYFEIPMVIKNILTEKPGLYCTSQVRFLLFPRFYRTILGRGSENIGFRILHNHCRSACHDHSSIFGWILDSQGKHLRHGCNYRKS